MGFHGLTPKDIERGRSWASRDRDSINDDATATELAIVAERFARGMYPGITINERREVLNDVRIQALTQAAAALELGLSENEQWYGAVAAVAREVYDIYTPGAEIHEATEDEEKLYYKIIRDS